MTRDEVMADLQEIFRSQFDDEDIVLSDGTTAADIEDWDSLAHMELIARVEAHSGIHFSLGQINNFANVGEMRDCIVDLMSAKGGR